MRSERKNKGAGSKGSFTNLQSLQKNLMEALLEFNWQNNNRLYKASCFYQLKTKPYHLLKLNHFTECISSDTTPLWIQKQDHDNFHKQRAESWRNWAVCTYGELQQGVGMNPHITQIHLETVTEELDLNIPFSFHFLDFPPLDLQTDAFLTLLFPVPHFLDTDSTELVPAPTCDDTGAHSHEQSL